LSKQVLKDGLCLGYGEPKTHIGLVPCGSGATGFGTGHVKAVQGGNSHIRLCAVISLQRFDNPFIGGAVLDRRLGPFRTQVVTQTIDENRLRWRQSCG